METTKHGEEKRPIRKFVLNKETNEKELIIVGYEDTQALLQELAESVSLQKVMVINPLTGETTLRRSVSNVEYVDTRNIPRDILEHTRLLNTMERKAENTNKKIDKWEKENPKPKTKEKEEIK